LEQQLETALKHVRTRKVYARFLLTSTYANIWLYLLGTEINILSLACRTNLCTSQSRSFRERQGLLAHLGYKSPKDLTHRGGATPQSWGQIEKKKNLEGQN
jgi:hypothetical protein